VKKKEEKHCVKLKFSKFFNIQILLDSEKFTKQRKENFVLLWTLPMVEIFREPLRESIRKERRMVEICNTGVKIMY